MDAHIDNLITQFNLQHDFDTTIDRLGRFKRRKLLLAMALAGGSEILLLDEPTKGVRKEKRHLIWDVLIRMTEGKAVIICTEDIEEAQQLGDRICVMSHGKILANDTLPMLEKTHNVGYKLKVQSSNFNPSDDQLEFGQQSVKQQCEAIQNQFSLKVDKSQLVSDQIVYMINKEHESQMSNILKEFEKQNDLQIELQQYQFQDAYNEILKSN